MQAREIYKGQKVYWNDPDTECDCSGTGIVDDVPEDLIYEDTVIGVVMDDGGYVECLPHELNSL